MKRRCHSGKVGRAVPCAPIANFEMRRAEDCAPFQGRRFLSRVISTVSLLAAMPCAAGVVVVQNVSPGATTWPGTPIISTFASPSSATTGESFNGGGGNTNLSQTFTVSSAMTLAAISVYVGTGGGSGTSTSAPVTLNLYDLGVQASNPNPYTGSIVGDNLFGVGAGLPIRYVPQPDGVLEFDFTDSDQVALQAGHMYAFELAGLSGTTPLYWQRVSSNPYSGGAAYRNRSLITSSGNTRDFALAVYTNVPPPPAPTACTVDWNDLRQRIDGFGGGVQFLNPGSLDPVPDSVMDTLFGTNANQLSLTLLRIGIDPRTNWNNQLLDAQKAVARGAGILATPWSPPAYMKNNTNTIGGALLPEHYTDYANYLNYFAGYMASHAAPLKVISLQNEPDFSATYDSCVWAPTQFLVFCHDAAALITNAPVMMPESLRYNFAMSDPTLNDPVAAANVQYVGGHLYGGAVITDYTNAHSKGKPTWMTEYLVNDQTIETAVATGEQVHECLTIANMSAYIWWKAYGDANGVVNAAGAPQKRGFVLGQWSRFARPNDYRIGATNSGLGYVSAFRNTNSGQFAIVAVNNSGLPVAKVFALENFPSVPSVTPWITASNLSLSAQTSLSVASRSFAYTLPPVSVVTFVGQASNAPPARPVFTSISFDGSLITLTIDGDAGPNYELFGSTNLIDWQLLLTTNPPTLPFSVIDTNAFDARRFYRLQLQ